MTKALLTKTLIVSAVVLIGGMILFPESRPEFLQPRSEACESGDLPGCISQYRPWRHGTGRRSILV